MTSLAGLQIAEWDHLKWKQIPQNMSNYEHLNWESFDKNCCMAVPDNWNPAAEKALEFRCFKFRQPSTELYIMSQCIWCSSSGWTSVYKSVFEQLRTRSHTLQTHKVRTDHFLFFLSSLFHEWLEVCTDKSLNKAPGGLDQSIKPQLTLDEHAVFNSALTNTITSVIITNWGLLVLLLYSNNTLQFDKWPAIFFFISLNDPSGMQRRGCYWVISSSCRHVGFWGGWGWHM